MPKLKWFFKLKLKPKIILLNWVPGPRRPHLRNWHRRAHHGLCSHTHDSWQVSRVLQSASDTVTPVSETLVTVTISQSDSFLAAKRFLCWNCLETETSSNSDTFENPHHCSVIVTYYDCTYKLKLFLVQRSFHVHNSITSCNRGLLSGGLIIGGSVFFYLINKGGERQLKSLEEAEARAKEEGGSA